MVEVSPQRASALLTQHAEYKIYLREMATARQMLYEALELDKDNVPAQQLLQVRTPLPCSSLPPEDNRVNYFRDQFLHPTLKFLPSIAKETVLPYLPFLFFP